MSLMYAPRPFTGTAAFGNRAIEPTSSQGGGPSASTQMSPPATSGMVNHSPFGQRLAPTAQNFASFRRSPSATPFGGGAGLSSSSSANRSPVMAYEDGGSVDDDNDQNAGSLGVNTLGVDDQTSSINKALETVNDALMYGRRLAGIGGGQQDQSQGYAEGGPVDDEDVRASMPSFSEPEEPASGGAPIGDPGGTGTEGMPFGQIESSDQEAPIGNPAGNGTEGMPEGQAPQMFPPVPQQVSQAAGQAGQAVAGGANKLMDYVTGAGAAAWQAVQSAEQQVDPQGAMDEDARKLATVNAVGQDAGPQAAWSVMQHYRKAYDSYRSYAAAAVTGGGGKPPNINDAVQAANKAFPNALDGTKTQFAMGQDGSITATVTNVGQDKPFFSQQLTVPQFYELMRGQSGQYDNVLENGAPGAIKQAASGEGRQPTAPQGQPGQQSGAFNGAPTDGSTNLPMNAFVNPQARPKPIAQYSPPQQPQAQQGQQPQKEGSFYNYDNEAKETGWDKQAIIQSHKMFPWISQEKQRLQWLAANAEHTADEANKVEAAKLRTDATMEAAKVRANASQSNSERHYGVGGASDRQAAAATERATKRVEAMKQIADTNVRAHGANADMSGRWRALGSRIANTPGITMDQVIDEAHQLGLPVDQLAGAAAGVTANPTPQPQAPSPQGNGGYRIMVDPKTNKPYKVKVQ